MEVKSAASTMYGPVPCLNKTSKLQIRLIKKKRKMQADYYGHFCERILALDKSTDIDIVTVYYKLSIISFRQTMFRVECLICAINAETIDFLFSKMNGLGATACTNR